MNVNFKWKKIVHSFSSNVILSELDCSNVLHTYSMHYKYLLSYEKDPVIGLDS